MGEAELAEYKLPKGTVAQIDATGKITVVSKPTSKELEERNILQRKIDLLVYYQYYLLLLC